MKEFMIIGISVLVLLSCSNQPDTHVDNGMKDLNQQENLLASKSSDTPEGLKWLNEPAEYAFGKNKLLMTVGPETDFFIDPATNTIHANAPFLYREMPGDFVATALLKPDLSDMWNAMALMMHIDDRNWIKFAFEKSDATGKSIVTVVTRDVSDDANGVILEEADRVWLKLARKNDIYSMHWSLDNKDYKMARLSLMPPVDTVKIGIEAQCPVGERATHEALFFSVENLTINDLRKIEE